MRGSFRESYNRRSTFQAGHGDAGGNDLADEAQRRRLRLRAGHGEMGLVRAKRSAHHFLRCLLAEEVPVHVVAAGGARYFLEAGLHPGGTQRRGGDARAVQLPAKGARVRSTNDLVAAYTFIWGKGVKAAAEATWMMRLPVPYRAASHESYPPARGSLGRSWNPPRHRRWSANRRTCRSRRVHQERDAGVFRGKRCANVRDVGLAGEIGGYRAGGRVQLAGHVCQGLSLRATSHSSSATCCASSCRANSRPSPEDAPVMMATRFERIHGKSLF